MSDAPPDLDPLIRAVAAGDRAAFRALYDATAAKLFGIVLRICRDRSLSEDVLQDAYVRIWRSAERFDAASGRPVTWMAAIARNAAIDAIRARRTRTDRITEVEDGALAALADPTALAVHPADREALRRCLDRLDDEQRTCILLAYMDGWSREELAERFARPVGTIKTWLHRGLQRLKDCLDPDR